MDFHTFWLFPEHIKFCVCIFIKAVSEMTNRQIESVNRERESLSNLVIDDNFRISNNLGLGLAR